MGITIDDCISKLTEILKEATEDENSVCYVTDVDEPTLKTAIETMRKYQKIVQIMERTVDDGTSMYDTLQEIEAVIEDGNGN